MFSFSLLLYSIKKKSNQSLKKTKFKKNDLDFLISYSFSVTNTITILIRLQLQQALWFSWQFRSYGYLLLISLLQIWHPLKRSHYHVSISAESCCSFWRHEKGSWCLQVDILSVYEFVCILALTDFKAEQFCTYTKI